MEIKNEVYEIVRARKEIIKEYYVDVPGFEHRVYGKVSKLTYEDHVRYFGEFSHYFLYEKDAPDYIGNDENIQADDFDLVEIEVKQHLESFTAEFGTIENEFYT